MESVLQFLTVVLIVQSVASLAAALRLARYALRRQTLRHHRYQPKAVVIIPCKGLEPGLEANVNAFCWQEYRDYELIFVTESEKDPAHSLIERVIKGSRRSAWLVVAGEAEMQGQKIQNLLAALETFNAMDRRVEVIVFADSDARPMRNWLAELIAPLDEKRVGAATGFRWHVPVRGGFSSLLLSVWNSSALTLLGERSSFTWGGATAIRRENFDQLGIKERWEGALSDDYVLTSALRETGQRIKFAPSCLMATNTESGLRDLLEFTTRQMRITRVYAPGVWWLAMVSHSLFNLTVWGGLIWCAVESAQGRVPTTILQMLATVLLLGAVSGWIRVLVAARLIEADRKRIFKQAWAHALLSPVASILYLCNLIASIWSSRIIWRGIGYEMVSPSQTKVWHRPPAAESSESSLPLQRKRRTSARSSSSSS